MRTFLLLIVLLVASPFCTAATGAESPNFDREIAPLLASHCLDCHRGAEAKGGLDLSRSATARTGGDSGPAVVARSLDESQLWQRVSAGEMPPKKPLAVREQALLKRWIEAGARWGTDPIDPFRYSTATRAGYDWWSLQPVREPSLPATVAEGWSRNGIDAFIASRLNEAGLKPSGEADRRALIRRLSFDLLGLPPSPEEVAAFEQDTSPDAYDRLVDRLLASPRYGERWARHWLDVAHFGESDGFEFDRMRPNAWRYRDWVIDALNRDLPYDEFARQQIAGDLFAKDQGGLAATGFLVAGAHDSLMPAGDAMRAVMRQDELEDIVGTVGQTFLGMTVHCARCHDHKFDPISQKDYFRLAAALSGVKRGDRAVEQASPVPLWMATRPDELRRAIEHVEGRARAAILARREEKRKSGIAVPQPIARWTFDVDGRDEIGDHHLELQGSATIEGGKLLLDGEKGHAISRPLAADLREKTLEAWVLLANLAQRGGGVLTVETSDGSQFDSIVFAERAPGQWVPGSDFFRRTQDVGGPNEGEADKQAVHVAIVYHDGGGITMYRNGRRYGKAYASGRPLTFKADESHVVLGVRHLPAGGGRMLAGSIEKAQLYDRALSAEEVADSAGVETTDVSDQELVAELSIEERAQREQLQRQLATAADQLARWNESKVFTVTPQQPATTRLLVRGSTLQPAEVVSPGGLSAVGADHGELGLAADAPEADRRRKLAEWIARAENPLFARTIVNRLWHYHFGRGLVETPNDLGFSGGQPTHPELLDWLAAELVRRRFCLKEMHRLIVTSATYRQASTLRGEAVAIDADNRLLWRMSPRRLDAESLRDAMLAVAGELNETFGGPSFHDFRLFNRAGTQFYEPQDLAGFEFQRRSIYRMWARGGKNPLLDTFDCPDPSTTAPKRSVTTTPLQALSLLNNAFTLRMADALASDLERAKPDDVRGQVQEAFERLCGRRPSDEELRLSIPFIEMHGLSAYCRVLFNSNAFLYLD